MEVSLESRLPEADSLPDGFVEISGEEPQSYPFSQKSSAPVSPASRDSRPFEERVAFDRTESATEVVSSRFNFAESGDNVSGPRGSFTESVASSKVEQDHSSNFDNLKSSRYHGANLRLKEMSSSLPPDYLTNPKPEVSEGKGKSGKRNVKSGKESSDFNLMRYQKVITERDAAIAVREKLESLCRELQRQNKLLTEECKRVSTEGQKLRVEFSKKFNDTIEDVSKKLEMQKDECIAQLKENEQLRTKMIQLTEQYALSEKAFQEKLEQKMLELQLADLKIQQHQERVAQEQTQKKLYVKQISQLLETEKSLRLQLASDRQRFQEFQETMQKSNEVFDTFNKEMAKTTKLVTDLKKENTSLRSKCEEKNYSITGLLSERESMKNELAKVKRQKENLESLCRSLQAERKKNREGPGQKSSTGEGEGEGEDNPKESVLHDPQL